MKFSKQLLVVLSLALVVGCTARYTPDVYNVKNAAVVAQSQHVSTAEVGKAIDSSAISLGWNMQHVRPGYTIATLHIRDHMARVGINYSAKDYSITYLDSKNLIRAHQIHKNYNAWVHNLDNAIKHNLSALN